AFSLRAWPLTLLELLPDTAGHHHYRIHAEVRQMKCEQDGRAGIYFAGVLHTGGNVPLFSFLRVTFNDIHDVMDQYLRLPPEVKKRSPKPAGNPVEVSSR